jgi:hypothetical protein
MTHPAIIMHNESAVSIFRDLFFPDFRNKIPNIF